jgi:hypothetical protein
MPKENILGNTLSPTKTKMTDTSNLLGEAKKYKSADEFVESTANRYHATTREFDEFDMSKV